jgi:hypothetical protein
MVMSKNLSRLVLLISFVTVLLGCGKAEALSVPVVGVKGPVSLFADAKFEKEAGQLETGAPLTVLSTDEDAIRVKTQSGQEGWLRRCFVCSSTELERRKASKQLPESVLFIGSDGSGIYLYGGSLSISNGRPSIKAGDAFWMDSTMRGKSFNFGGEAIAGDPSVLLLKPESGNMIRLQTWPPTEK